MLVEVDLMSRGAVNDRPATIGEAAALYGLAPSTVRWWERQGVLGQPARGGGRRIYLDTDLRRIGVAYLCCVVGKMPLDQAAVVTSGKAPHSVWQQTVGEQIGEIERRIEQLRAAKDYLHHLLRCEDDDMVECRFLERELTTHTPRGQVCDSDLVTAARSARDAGPGPDTAVARNEIPTDRPTRDENPGRCTGCRGRMPRLSRGRPRKYCSHACRQRAYRARRTAATGESGR